MSIIQLNIFECDISIQRDDFIFLQLEELQIESQLFIGDLRISRTEKFYIVEREAEFEEVFRDIKCCYEFINQV
ncbi:hypothetical protein ACIQXW_11295 [Lysinibacillus sp. NPDC097162]|uniref:hypothetical protein n=1 Tax=Lysinibacillus sp. NPDC097162 TaxID=3364140 RepID=UPI0038095606